MIDAITALMRQDARILLTAPNQGEVERLAGLLQEYHLPYRLGSRSEAHGSENVYSESSHVSGDCEHAGHHQDRHRRGRAGARSRSHDGRGRSSSSAPRT